MTPVVLAAVAVVVAALGVAAALPLGGEGEHAVTHLAPGAAALLGWAGMRRLAAPRSPVRSGARRVLVSGLAVFAVAQTLEAAGAFGYRGDERANPVATLHDVGVLLGPVGLVLLLGGILLSVFAAIAARRGGASRRASWLAVAAVVTLALGYVLGGVVFGY